MANKELNFENLFQGTIYGPRSQYVSSVVYDSREAEEGDAFVCIAGEKHDGHLFIEQAIQNGANTIIGTKSEKLYMYSTFYKEKSFICVSEARTALAQLASTIYDSPSNSLYTIGVTGTNGKTTVSSFLYSLLNDLRLRTGSLGTAGIWDDEKKTEFKQTVPTTPEAPDIHRVLHYFRKREMTAAIIESTSIALEQKRLATIHFDVAVHTNLTPEHLEFHGTMEAYKQAKMKLFDQSRSAIVNADDSQMAEDLIRGFKGTLITYGIEEPADISAKEIRTTMEGTSFTLCLFREEYHLHAPIFGTYNVSNFLAAIAVCCKMGYSAEEILSVVSTIQSPEGRFQIVENKAPFQIVLDYAHTPDALFNILNAVQHIPYRNLIVMITGVGLRDPKKRPMMAEVADGVADQIVVSVDQPGHADRQGVVNDVLKGFKDPAGSHIHSVLHREEAIHFAFGLAEPDDLVLLTGIGFGGYQIIGDEKVPYSEIEVIEDYFKNFNCNKQALCES
ncbi:UDP-N-acetylmuramoyl-L-alanyl-D-glutamate--2,6-diaminopimelate ligase [Halobacillus halophilus]|uniref:UDP-N-acetylmuramoyl-L-alanyl-D-glutamate--2, 6-diaminopimelate ligase n=1 Tax=Halobacillus halophilus TaxID=1570 RepID=UPI001CD61852|nr:UDP-N-acetylmuramoyl-L-alanyl-D-glutamate--2,6-diaminopimelate ligase [Halobacillus halophilus]MCA1009190.1 UDP-N-acetylmuramoyl-L-alanyl-D-glutamate--2,6-diaminopimelate ligase [Halobacillus halophilus]